MQFSEDSPVHSTFVIPWYRNPHQGNLICRGFLWVFPGPWWAIIISVFFPLLLIKYQLIVKSENLTSCLWDTLIKKVFEKSAKSHSLANWSLYLFSVSYIGKPVDRWHIRSSIKILSHLNRCLRKSVRDRSNHFRERIFHGIMSGCVLFLGREVRFSLLIEDFEFWSLKIDHEKIIALKN
jgi:hypothetical protein